MLSQLRTVKFISSYSRCNLPKRNYCIKTYDSIADSLVLGVYEREFTKDAKQLVELNPDLKDIWTLSQKKGEIGDCILSLSSNGFQSLPGVKRIALVGLGRSILQGKTNISF